MIRQETDISKRQLHRLQLLGAKMAALCIAFIAIGTLESNAQTMMNVKARNVVSLDGEWHYIIDPQEAGGWAYYRDGHFDGTYATDYDFELSPTIKVPGDWNTQNDWLFYYEGIVWYQKKFRHSTANGNRLFLHFDGANYRATVWLNGKEVGNHEGGFTPFEFDVTDLVKNDGDNTVVVKVDNIRLRDGVPTNDFDWWNFGGITRSVSLIETPATFIYDYNIQLSKTDNKHIEGWIKLSGSDIAEKEVTLSIPELHVKKTLVTDENGRASFTLKAKPQYWSPAQPKLYSVDLTLDNETLNDQIGFRTIQTDGGKILLNGKPIYLAGVNIHEETIGDCRRATSVEDDSLLLQAAKDVGCNFVRLCHYPHNEEMVRLADRMGMLVWEESPLYWHINWKSDRTFQLASQQLSEIIQRDRNRASIIIWSIANETQESPERNRFLINLANQAHQQDPTRLVSAALFCSNSDDKSTDYKPDPLGEVLDVFSFNQYRAWYGKKDEDFEHLTWKVPENKPVIASEFGAGAKYGFHSATEDYFSEEFQAYVYRNQFVMLANIENLAGTTPWILKDFRSPRRNLATVQDGFNRKGVLSEKGEKKLAWQILKDWNLSQRAKFGGR